MDFKKFGLGEILALILVIFGGTYCLMYPSKLEEVGSVVGGGLFLIYWTIGFKTFE